MDKGRRVRRVQTYFEKTLEVTGRSRNHRWFVTAAELEDGFLLSSRIGLHRAGRCTLVSNSHRGDLYSSAAPEEGGVTPRCVRARECVLGKRVGEQAECVRW